MSDTKHSDSEHKDCCKKAVERYRQKVVAHREVSAKKYSTFMLWAAGITLTFVVVLGPSEGYPSAYYVEASLAFVCWCFMFADIYQWVKKKRFAFGPAPK